MSKWRTLESNYVVNSPFGNIRKDTCELPDGRIIDDYYVNEYPDWVNAIVLTKAHQVVLVQQYRQAGEDFFLEIPAGKPEGEEPNDHAVMREVREETGFVSEQAPHLLGEFFVNPATQTNKVISYLIVDAYHNYEQELDPTEFIDVHLVDLDEVEGMIAQQDIQQFFTVSAFYMAKAFLMKHNG
ncbi:NUDIX hydrolase [Thalassobacillus sp. CUG 92003]|uniref:NUDIX hydrolase n=1 Tax=Thalassobacillus sp. CUG 92003 TaxID=2736641 RepID=UPI0015E7DF9B|nr:NUDIX hydrolase [Thalassobacillus sp. CUG 92003]